ncbi:hypothetical protein HRbin40_02181 [bacterium HR40]|nr:hypothetical protein HRbin40_02181 [bacterium HR40]
MNRTAAFVLTVDVEEYYHAWALASVVPFASWDHFPSRVVAPTLVLLDLLAATGARATFFVLGQVARRHPELVRRIVAAGHEVASHGCDHRLVWQQTPAEFRADVRTSRALLEDVAGVRVQGFRAANFSIDHRTPWAHSILAEEGYRYSSSSHPVLNDRYGSLTGNRRPSRRDGVLEIPIATLRAPGINLPCGGGGYFRLLPTSWTRFALARVLRRDNQPAVFYIHPWELDPDQPRPPGLPALARLRHYRGLDTVAPRLAELLARFGSQRLDLAFGLAPLSDGETRP